MLHMYSVVQEKLKKKDYFPSSIPDACLLRLTAYAEVNHCPLKLHRTTSCRANNKIHQPKSYKAAHPSE